MKSQVFRQQISSALIQEAPNAPKPKPARKKVVSNADRLTGRHFPAFNEAKDGAKHKRPARDCVACNLSFKQRQQSGQKYIRATSIYNCPDCNVVLCVPRCFEVYHTYQNYRAILSGEDGADGNETD